ncbi:DHA2 family efflux MFS transporter permease subunit [Mycolicibacterium pulveris]|uniref:DHA2 family efflux MFS transporter permease subunit n=1 Tax=Mycolicibacterium pulveris TaxID=36813 RepID=UPI003CF17839
MTAAPTPPALTSSQPFRAVWAMMVGFFLIIVDSTVVAVANPIIKEDFAASYEAVIWATSAYLLMFAALLLVGGRLGDRFGPKNVYLIGLALFTAASLWCGMSESIGMLIGGRVAQGIGAALLTPQTLSVVTRTFPTERRGIAMSIWGATAAIGMFVGPLAGGLLVDGLGWRWIFLFNVPIGVLGFILARRLVPALPGRRQRFDVLGVLLSGAGICLIVFGLQEGRNHSWALDIWVCLIGGLVLLAVFVIWQSVQPHEPLVPLKLFRHRDFGLANVGIALTSFAVVAFVVPLMFYLQEVRVLSATHAALVTVPMAVSTGLLAPVAGRLVDRVHPRVIVGPGFAAMAVALVWLALEMAPATPVWRLMLPLTVIGAAGAFTWEPLAAIASRTLPTDLAGAGSAVFNTLRQVGAVLSSAGIAALMTALLQRRPDDAAELVSDSLQGPFADAMAQSVLLPAAAAGLGALAALFFVGNPHPSATVKHQPKSKAGTAI